MGSAGPLPAMTGGMTGAAAGTGAEPPVTPAIDTTPETMPVEPMEPAMMDSAPEPATPEPTEPTTAANPDDSLDSLRQLCLDTINGYRSGLGLPPLMRASVEIETCSDAGAMSDATTGQAHGSAGSCSGLGAQNTCPGWGVGGFSGNATIEDALQGCLAGMWAEGEPPVSRQACIADYVGCFLQHGHFLNMSDPNARVVSCGFYMMDDGRWWMNQDFGR